jgi:hypothetical protein
MAKGPDWNDVHRVNPGAVRDALTEPDIPFKPVTKRRGNGHDAAADALRAAEGVSLDDFRAFMEIHAYIFTPSGAMWPASSVNSRIPPVPLVDKNGGPLLDDKGKQRKISAAAWLDKHRPVETMTWAPGEPMLIPDRLISDGGWISRKGVTCFNLYRSPLIIPRGAVECRRWLDHADKVFPGDAEHIVKWLAHRVQHPEQKINHALILGGNQGVGKDTLLEPVKRAIGPWNFLEVSPQQTLEPYNGFLKSVILRVNEARDLGDIDRFKFYDHMKAYTAAPPDVLRVNEKYLKAHYVFNCTGVIITSNHKADGIFLPADDRRHFVAWSDLTKEDFAELLECPLELVRARWVRQRRGLSRRTRYFRLRRKSAAGEDAGILGYRGREPCTRRRRACGRARRNGKS